MDIALKDDSLYVAWCGHVDGGTFSIAKINKNTGTYFYNNKLDIGGSAVVMKLVFVGNRDYILHNKTGNFNGTNFTGGNSYLAELNPANGAFKSTYTAFSLTNISSTPQINNGSGLAVLPRSASEVYVTGSTNSLAAAATASFAGNTITNTSSKTNPVHFATILTMNADGTFATSGLTINTITEQNNGLSAFQARSNVNSSGDLYTALTGFVNNGSGLQVLVSGDATVYPTGGGNEHSIILSMKHNVSTYSYLDKVVSEFNTNCPYIKEISFDSNKNLYALYTMYPNAYLKFGTYQFAGSSDMRFGWAVGKYTDPSLTTAVNPAGTASGVSIMAVSNGIILSESAQVEAFNFTGSTVYKGNVNGQLIPLAKGAYIVKAIANGKQAIQKLIVR